jgi:hypothetical protein
MADHMQAQLQAYIESALPQWAAPLVGPVGRISDGWESELFTLDVEHGRRRKASHAAGIAAVPRRRRRGKSTARVPRHAPAL